MLRVLGNLLNLTGFDYQSSEDIREELKKLCDEHAGTGYKGSHKAAPTASGNDVLDISMYHIDALVRRAPSLQKTREGRTLAVTY